MAGITKEKVLEMIDREIGRADHPAVSVNLQDVYEAVSAAFDELEFLRRRVSHLEEQDIENRKLLDSLGHF